MKIHSKNIKQNYFDDAIGKHGAQFLLGKKPNYSFHLAWEELPENASKDMNLLVLRQKSYCAL